MESSMPHIPMIGNNKKEEKEETEEEREARLAEEARIHEEEEARLKKLKVMSYFPKGWVYSEECLELKQFLKPKELSHSFMSLHASFGVDVQKRYNIEIIDYGVVLFATGNTVQILDLFMHKKKILMAPGDCSFNAVGAIAVHPSKEFFAVAEIGLDPKIYVYTYPGLRTVRILRKGTERGYSDIEFSHTGNKLASVGRDPDYLLTVWDWQKERVILRTKAFAQDVYRVRFSPVNEGRLITSGTGHIRFWKMAKTFTGLKLQGDIGKFGNIELSDISSFVELPDGKVISGTESGRLLMWDGNFIQFQIAKPGGEPCHEGVVEFLALEDRTLVTAGRDGYVRYWKFDEVEFAEATDDSSIVEVVPEKEIRIGDGVQIQSMVRGEDHWLVVDFNGGLYKLWTPSHDIERLLDVHSGSINGVAVAPRSHIAVTCGSDSTVRCWDLVKGEALYSRSFASACTCLHWAPDTVDDESRLLLVGFSDGVVRVVRRFAQSFQLHHTFKPHTHAVCQMKISPDGETLVTADEFGNLFFFSVQLRGGRYSPLGFIDLGSKPVSLNWSYDSAKVLLACAQEVVEVPRPDAALYESKTNRDTYQINLNIRRFKPDIKYEPEEYEDEEEEEEDDEDLDDEARDARRLRQEERRAAEERKRAELEARIEDIAVATYLPNSTQRFLLCLDGGVGGYDGTDEDLPVFLPGQRYERLYECSFKQEEPHRVIDLGLDTGSVSFLDYSLSGKYLLIGFQNGGAQLRPIKDLEYYFNHTSHSGMHGHVTGVCSTFDDSIFMSVGADGNFFVYTIDPESALKVVDRSVTFEIDQEQDKAEQRRLEYSKREAAVSEELKGKGQTLADPILDLSSEDVVVADINAKSQVYSQCPPAVFGKSTLPLPIPLDEKLEAKLALEDAADILGKHYSIEEAKLKQEEDDRIAAGEAKKEVVRQEIRELRKEFQYLLKKNESLDLTQRLPRDAFELDPKLRNQLELDAQKRIEAVKAELAWISEKHTLALKKLRQKFLDPLIVEHIKMLSFRTNISVSCFRTPKLPTFLREAIESVHKLMASEEQQRKEDENKMNMANQLSNSSDDKNGGVDGGSRGGLASSKSQRRGHTAAGGRHSAPGVSEAELRKKAREERKKELERLKAAKPDKNIDDPKDVAAMRYAQENMGDYKLKSDPNYKVPEDQRVNAERKRRQMVLLQESVHYIKMGLNERFLAMRDLKKRIITNIKTDNVRLRELNSLLDIEEDLYEPEIDPSEWPEHRELYTKEDLIAFEKHQEKERLRAQLARKSQSSLFDQDEPSDSDEEEIKQGDKAGSGDKGGDSEKERGSKAGAKILDGADGSANADKDVDLMTDVSSSHDERIELIPKSAMEEAEEKMRKRLLQHERKKLKEKIEFAINTFDRAIAKLRREKLKLDADLKTTDLKMLTLYEELHLLREFEDTENRLVAKFKKAKAAKAQVVADMTDCEKQLAAKLSEIKAWKEKDIQVMNEFNLVVGGEKNPFYATLLKIFKKNVKRNKSKKARDADLNDEDDSDADNDQYDSDDDGSDDESDTDEENDDACPDKCENSIYEKVLELREKRLEQEEIYMEFKKAVGELNKTYYDRHQGREKSIDKELINTNREIEAFQQEKQRALNLIEVTVPLKLAQMKYLVGGKLPANISDSLIFTSTGMQTLRERIEELVEEKNNLTLQFKALKRGHKILIKELQQKRDLIAVEKKKCEDVQMLKFGQIIDLSILAKVGVDEGAAELRRKLKVLEGTSVRKLTEWDRRIMEAKNELATITQQNTSWLERVAQLTKAQYDLEDQLNSTTKNVHVADTSPVDEKDSNERRQLLQLVQIQEKEIDALKAEIHVLRRKGGHVYTPQ